METISHCIYNMRYMHFDVHLNLGNSKLYYSIMKRENCLCMVLKFLMTFNVNFAFN